MTELSQKASSTEKVYNPFLKFEQWLLSVLNSGTSEYPRPSFNKDFQSNVPGLYVIGDIAGAPVIKLAMEQGYKVIENIATLPDAKADEEGVYDILVVGSGASGLNAALQARERGLSCIVLEKEKVATTIENFPEGKWVYAEPDEVLPKGKLWLDGATKEDLLNRWHQIINENDLNVHTDQGVEGVVREGKNFTVKTESGDIFKSRRVILAIGQRGNSRKLGVLGEERECVYHRLYAPKNYHDEDIIVVGGGNSAVEAALVLSENNRVVLSYRKDTFARLFKDNKRKIDNAVREGKIKVILNSHVMEFADGYATLRTGNKKGEKAAERVSCQHAFVLIGSELPVRFLKKQGIRLEGEWSGNLWRSLGFTLLSLVGLAIWGGDSHDWNTLLIGWVPYLFGVPLFFLGVTGLFYGGLAKKERLSWLGIAFLLSYTIYGVKVGGSAEFWPFRGWGNNLFSFCGRPWAFWYTVIYTAVMTTFGISAMKQWGFDKKDRLQVYRYSSLIGFQWIMFFIIPEFLFRFAVEYKWVGDALASDPNFAGQAWRTYGIIYAWPLFFYTFFYDPHQIWVVWGAVLTFAILPIFALFHGKRYCTWICGCGGLAETLGNRWRVLAPKGNASIKLEKMNVFILWAAFIVTGVMLLKDLLSIPGKSAEACVYWYKILVDVWLVGIIPVALYPFLGGKVWCRYWCPLAKLMDIFSHRLKGRFKITANDKCISCHECSRYCQVGIPVMQYAMKQEVIGNFNTSCIGCGMCVTACPMDVLSFGSRQDAAEEHVVDPKGSGFN
ncbi:MAG: NAD(P)-binding domain-containing protein [Planctomycetes bacterium]|nr:NAD(P)-binding domain-containing protein [Planctomycetota bacterium]